MRRLSPPQRTRDAWRRLVWTFAKLTVIESGYPSEDLVALSRGGLEQCLDKLAKALAGTPSATLGRD